MSMIKGAKILLGISGGIAAYKSPQIVRKLKELEANVQIVFSKNAHEFVTKVTLQSLSGAPVRQSLWDTEAEAAMSHIELAKWADLIIIAPATANCISKLANGHADDLLSTVVLATEAKIFLAPSMNQKMFSHQATQYNLNRIKELGYEIIGPNSGSQACGDEGPGRMTEPEEIIASITSFLSSSQKQKKLRGLNVMVTAGPTRERLDPVRYITNDSSGKQGLAIVEAAVERGAKVTLIAGPNVGATSTEVQRVDIESALEMNEAVQNQLSDINLFIGVAAVADFRPSSFVEDKIKRAQLGSSQILELTENPDVIANVAKEKNGAIVVGFAAETSNSIENAREKRIRKGIDAIVVNDVSDKTIGFNSNENAFTLIHPNGELNFTKKSKRELANELLDNIVDLFNLTDQKVSAIIGTQQKTS